MESMEHWDKLLHTKDQPILLQLSASWCRPCQMLRPLMKKAVDQQEGKVTGVYIDVDKYPDVSHMLQVQHIPMLFLMKDGELLEQWSGMQNDSQINDIMIKAHEV